MLAAAEEEGDDLISLKKDHLRCQLYILMLEKPIGATIFNARPGRLQVIIQIGF